MTSPPQAAWPTLKNAHASHHVFGISKQMPISKPGQRNFEQKVGAQEIKFPRKKTHPFCWEAPKNNES